MNTVLIIIPTYNEAQNIDNIVVSLEHVASHLRSYSFSILIVDDNSPDGTAKHVISLQKQYNNIHILSGPKSGLGRAYIRGFQYALSHKEFKSYDSYIMMDADMSHNPSDIPALLKSLNQGADYVIGSRYISRGSISDNWPLHRTVISKVGNLIARKLTGISNDVCDLTGGFKAIRVEALREINLDNLKAKGYVFQVSLLHAFIRIGFGIKEVPISFVDRQYGASKLRLSDILEFLYVAYKLNKDAPIQQIVRFCFVGACGAVVNLSVLSLLVNEIHTETLLSAAIAIECSIIFNFILNYRYTFKGYGSNKVRAHKEALSSLSAKMVKFNASTLGGAAISFTTFTLLFKYIHMHYLLADVISIVAAMRWNYFMSVRFVWKSID